MINKKQPTDTETLNASAEFLTPRELADLCSVSIKFVQKWTAARRMPGATRCGYHWRYNRQDVERQLAKGFLLLPADKPGTGA